MRRPVDILVGADRWFRRHNYKRKYKKGSPLELFQPFTEWHNRKADRNIADSWAEAIEQLLVLAEGTPYLASIQAMKLTGAFRPESMFYTQIGEPQRILLGGVRGVPK